MLPSMFLVQPLNSGHILQITPLNIARRKGTNRSSNRELKRAARDRLLLWSVARTPPTHHQGKPLYLAAVNLISRLCCISQESCIKCRRIHWSILVLMHYSLLLTFQFLMSEL